MEKKKISSISEAFSMQPRIFSVGDVYRYGGEDSKEPIISKIIDTEIYIDGDPYQYYVGYDDSGNVLFEYRKGTVNVYYKI